MSLYATGVNKTVAIATETTFGIASTGTGQYLRRISCQLNVAAPLIPSQEILRSQQVVDARQGPRQVNGTLSGQLSPTSYYMLFDAMLRGSFAAGGQTGTLADLTATATDGGMEVQIQSPSSNFISDGFNIGDVVKFTTLTGTYAADNGVNLPIIGLLATKIVAPTQPGFVNFTAAQTGKIVTKGYVLQAPLTGQVVPSFSIEEYESDIGVSRLSLGCEVSQMQIQMPARGFCTFSATILGQNQVVSNAQVYTTPTAATTTTSLTMNGGLVFYNNGTPLGYITSATLSISSAVQADPVIGSQLVPAIFMGTLSVTGSFTALDTPDTMTTDFLSENEVSLQFFLTTNPTTSADFISIVLPRVKLSAANYTDSDRAISRSFSFQALQNTDMVNARATTIAIQDSLQASP